jgi:RNA recognition motif. (a.k.a. RRM, RBD, or RNP domain)
MLPRRVHDLADTGRRRSFRTALLFLLLAHFSHLFLLTFGLPVVALVQENLRWCATDISTCFRALYSTHGCRSAETDAPIKHRDMKYATLAAIVDVPVPAEPPLEVTVKSDRATHDQVTGLRFAGSWDLSRPDSTAVPAVQSGLQEDSSSNSAARVNRGQIFMARIYVGNLPFSTTDEEVRALFLQHGTVESIKLPTGRETGRPRGFGFVEMNQADAARAIHSLNL